MEHIVFWSILVLFLAIWFINAILEERKRRRVFLDKLMHLDGKLPDKKQIPARHEHMRQRLEKEEGFLLDEITWDDLSMEQVFARMDYTFSAPGEECLYGMLRKPQLKPGALEEKAKYIAYFQEHLEERVKLQLLFAEIGRTGEYSLYDYLDYLETLPLQKNGKELGLLALIGVSAVVGMYLPQCFVVTGLLLVYNFGSYLRKKQEIEPFLTTFSYIIKLLKAAEAFQKVEAEVIQRQQKILQNNARAFVRFRAGSSLVIRKEISSGNPVEILWDLLCMLFHFDLIKFNFMHKTVKLQKKKLTEMFEQIGFVDAMISLALFRKSLPYYSVPVLFEKEKQERANLLEAEKIFHPLIQNPVANDIYAKKGVLLTGSNASGKSTFLKTVALNAILSQSVATAMAARYEACYFRVYSSMSLRDNLLEGDSYFIVEIKAIKRIMDAIDSQAYGEVPVLCFVDEVLRGTNTVERIAASTEILKALSKDKALCFAATHDLELTKLLHNFFDNYHFEEKLEKNDVTFAYQLLQGEATSRNAIALLRILGFDQHIIEEANDHAIEYLKQEALWRQAQERAIEESE